MAHKIIPIDKLRLIDMIRFPEEYSGLPDDLIKLPVPDTIRIKRKHYPVPQTFEELSKNICYGQRMFFSHEEENDFGVIIRVLDGYYFPIITGEKWDQDRAIVFGKNIITCKVLELYPVAYHIVKLIAQMIDREKKLLYREPSKMELAAGIEKLNKFTELSALNFLRDDMKITVEEVLLTPYDECLVRFMMAKEMEDYKTRYLELAQEEAKQKHGRSKT